MAYSLVIIIVVVAGQYEFRAIVIYFFKRSQLSLKRVFVHNTLRHLIIFYLFAVFLGNEIYFFVVLILPISTL